MIANDPTRRGLTRRRLAALAGAVVATRAVGARSARAADPQPPMTLTQKAAALFITSIAGTTLTADETAWLEQWRPGGVILTGANIGAPDETRALIAAIHATNPARPPLVATDEEGGPVVRLPDDPAPGAAAMGTMPDAEVERLSAARAAFLLNYGIDVNFAPVADIAWTPDSAIAGRAFGNDPATVAAKVGAFVRGAVGSPVATTAKHFPGHGRALVDSHEALPTIDVAADEWLRTDAVPFQAAIQAGVPFVMLGHLHYTQWDDLPT
ncbi:MAG TPA: glycoside hydrolase family 3 N-terminal domain-containing protein, partial [Thermomicrobiales bacterium]|nr:glycoside hydrolase family 3 N-terminal domain-containing protein [Thermomicrobiales bacterium]